MFVTDLGEGARLRPLEPWQAPEFLEHIDRARDYVDPWIPWTSRSTDLASARAVLQRYADQQAQDKARLYGIWLDGTLVGGVMLINIDADGGQFDVGCWLEPAGAGRGLVTRAAARLLDYGFTERGWHRANWKCRPDNEASRAVARRLGMRLEGTLREDFPHLGRRHDTEIWAILAREWTSTAQLAREKRGAR
ncbi:GNAT family protein [Actinoplanes sp. NPDC051470]|uniref:GNAT family N-acetyltransferase n=1 Tax=unclassified Actinoplanes TaxID=2626549 RepID=UPI003417030E